MAAVDWGSLDEGAKRKRIADAYQQYLGRAPEGESAYQSWLGNANFENAIAGSDEAKSRQGSWAAPRDGSDWASITPTAGPPRQFVGPNPGQRYPWVMKDEDLSGPVQADPFESNLSRLYQQYTHDNRAPTAAELTAHRGNPGGLAAIEAMLKSAGSGGGSSQAGAGSGDYSGFGNAWLASGGRTVEDLQRFIAANQQYGAQAGGSKGDKITIGGRTFDAVIGAGAGGQGASWSDITNGGGDSGGGGNQSNELFLNEALSRMQALRQPINDPFRSLYALQALQQAQNLKGAPYTAGEDAALRARYMEPLTQARDSLRQQTVERMGARNISPSSGLFQDAMGNLDKGYEQGVAQGSNDLAVRAIDEKQARDRQQLAILSSLLGVSSGARQEDNARGQELLQVASMFPEMDQRQLQMLLQASGEGAASPSSLSSILAQFNNQNMQQQQMNQQNSAATASAWGQYLGYLLNSL